MTDALSDPCPTCGFDGRSLRPPDLVATLRSLGRRWSDVLMGDVQKVGQPHVEAALHGMLATAGTVRADPSAQPRPTAAARSVTADPIAIVAAAIADALEGPDLPFEREGVHEAAVAAAHAGTHHLRLAEKALSGR